MTLYPNTNECGCCPACQCGCHATETPCTERPAPIEGGGLVLGTLHVSGVRARVTECGESRDIGAAARQPKKEEA